MLLSVLLLKNSYLGLSERASLDRFAHVECPGHFSSMHVLKVAT